MATYVCHNSTCAIRGKLVRRFHPLMEEPACFLCKTQLNLVQEDKAWNNSKQQLADEAYQNAAAPEKEFEFPPKINVFHPKKNTHCLN